MDDLPYRCERREPVSHHTFSAPFRYFSSSRRALLLFCLITLFFAQASLNAQGTTTLMPMGGGFEASAIAEFSRRAAQIDTNSVVKVLFIPATFTTDPYWIDQPERTQNTADANTRAADLQTKCNSAVTPKTCTWSVVPIFTRSDTANLSYQNMFDSQVDGIFIGGGGQEPAMEVLANTPIETAMQTAYNRGVPVGGSSAGSGVLSRYMLANYSQWASSAEQLQKSAVVLWDKPDSDFQRGLIFGETPAVLDQHFLQRGRWGRLLNAAYMRGGIGVGTDYNTIAQINNGTQLSNITGDTGVGVIDILAYNAPANARFRGPGTTLSIHDVALHLLPQGKTSTIASSYNLSSRALTVGGLGQSAPSLTGRSWSGALVKPIGSGTLILSGDVYQSVDAEVLIDDRYGAVMKRFLGRARPQGGARILIVAAGYAYSADAWDEMDAIGDALLDNTASGFGALAATTVRKALLGSTSNSTIQSDITWADGILFIGDDAALLSTQLFTTTNRTGFTTPLKNAWLAGKTVMADNAAAAALGQRFVALTPPPSDQAGREDAAIQSYYTTTALKTAAGLGWLAASFEPRALIDTRWGRMLYALYEYKTDTRTGTGLNPVIFGIADQTAIEFGAGSPLIIGQSAVIAVDARYTTRLWTGDANISGNKRTIGFAWMLLDTFAENDQLYPGTRTSQQPQTAIQPIQSPKGEKISEPAPIEAAD
jgi:cyanophycinase